MTFKPGPLLCEPSFSFPYLMFFFFLIASNVYFLTALLGALRCVFLLTCERFSRFQDFFFVILLSLSFKDICLKFL